MRQTLGVVLAVLLAVVLVNDVSRLAATEFAMNSIAQVAADAAAVAGRRTQEDTSVGLAAATAAIASEEASITRYTQENGRVHVWVEGPVSGTIVLSTIVSLLSGGTWNEPMIVRKDYERTF